MMVKILNGVEDNIKSLVGEVLQYRKSLLVLVLMLSLLSSVHTSWINIVSDKITKYT